jgi:hypothetical protein
VVKNDGSSLRNGTWKFYDPAAGTVLKTEFWRLGKLEDSGDPLAAKKGTDSLSSAKAKAKPKEVQDFEKKNSGRKKVKVRDGTVSDN